MKIKSEKSDLLLPPKSSLNGKCWQLQNALCRRRNSEDATSASSNSRNAFPNGFLSTLSTKQRDGIRRAQIARRKKLESRAEAAAIEIHVEDENDLIVKIKNIYDDLVNSKPPIDVFYVMIVSLRAFFAKETWKDRVEESVRDLLKRCLLQPASKMADKYLQFETEVPLARKIDEYMIHTEKCTINTMFFPRYKLQVFLHVYCIENDRETNLDENSLDTITSLLGIISLISDTKVLRDFFEELFENFVDSIPRHLTRLYEDLNQPIPIELEQYSTLGTEIPFYEPLVVPSPQKVTAASSNPAPQIVKHSANTLPSIQQEADESDFEEGEGQSTLSSTTSLSQSGSRSFRCSRSFMGTSKHHRLITVTSSGAKKLKLGRPPKIKSNGDDSAADNSNAVDFTETFRKMRQPVRTKRSLNFSQSVIEAKENLSKTPVGKGKANGQVDKLAPETPTFHQVRDSERKRRLMTKIASDPQIKRVIVQETPPKLWKARVPVRQSPRQHASTRALYSCAPRLISQLVKFSSSMTDGADINHYDFDLNEFSDEHVTATNTNINGQSPNFVYLKSKASSSQTKSASSSLKKKFGNVNLRDRTPVQTKLTRQLVSSDKKLATPNQAKQRPTVVSPARRLRRNLSQTFSNDDSNSTWSLNSASCASFAASCGSSSHQFSNFNGFGGASSPKKQCSATVTSATASEYAMPEMVVENYTRYMSNIKRERLKPSDDLFYARNNHRNSVFAEDSCASRSTHDTRSAAPSATTVGAAAPKSRSGRKMKSATVRYINSANYLLNIKNENQSQPCNLKNLRRTLSLNSPIKLNKNLRQLPKNCRKRYYNGKLSNNSQNNRQPEPKNNEISSTNVEENVALKPETPDGLLSPSKR